MSTLTFNAEDIFEEIPGDPDNVLFKIPPEICEQLNLKPGDTVNITSEDGCLIIKKHGEKL
jgi:AbrB family looped-hinge helix DNA binding protein